MVSQLISINVKICGKTNTLDKVTVKLSWSETSHVIDPPGVTLNQELAGQNQPAWRFYMASLMNWNEKKMLKHFMSKMFLSNYIH